MIRSLVWKLARPLGVRMVLGWLDDAASGRKGSDLHRAYWALAGWKTRTSVIVGIVAAILAALGHAQASSALTIVAGVGVSAGLLDRAWRAPHVPDSLRDHPIYRFLAGNSAGLTAGLLAALAWAQSSACQPLAQIGDLVLTCAALHQVLLALACGCGYLGLWDAAAAAPSPVSPAEVAIRRGHGWPPVSTLPPPPAATLLLAALCLAAVGCGSSAQLQLDHDRATHPDARVVRSYVCAGEDDAARLYLSAPAFAWLGPAIERYLTDARDAKRAGHCPCLDSGCAAR